MALSRILSQSLPRSSLCSPTALFTSLRRHRSSKSHRAELIEVEIDHASSDSPDEVINFGIWKLEDAIHSIFVRRCAPDWLPFLPGYSYWVPPRASSATRPSHPANSMIEALGKLASSRVGRDRVVRDRLLPVDLLSEDEQLAFTSSKGWPSSTFYIEGNLTIPINEYRGNNSSDTEDEEE